MSARRPAPPARPGARTSASGTSGGGGFVSWLPLLGGLALGAGILVYVINMFFGAPQTRNNCPKLDPKKQRWPEMKGKSWASIINRFK